MATRAEQDLPAGIESREQLEELYLPPADDFVILEVPRMKYFMVDGTGRLDPSHAALRWLFAAVAPVRHIAKERMGKRFLEPPLEGLWWADDVADFAAGNRDRLKWRMMIPVPAWATAKMLAEGVAGASKRLGNAPASLRLGSHDEGLSVQILHVGPPAEAAATIARLHQEFLPEHGLVPDGPHHEIYLTDPRGVAPQKMKTVLRQPVHKLARRRAKRAAGRSTE